MYEFKAKLNMWVYCSRTVSSFVNSEGKPCFQTWKNILGKTEIRMLLFRFISQQLAVLNPLLQSWILLFWGIQSYSRVLKASECNVVLQRRDLGWLPFSSFSSLSSSDNSGLIGWMSHWFVSTQNSHLRHKGPQVRIIKHIIWRLN